MIDIRLRLTQPCDLTAEATSVTLVEIEIVEDEESLTFALPVGQARDLAAQLDQLASGLTPVSLGRGERWPLTGRRRPGGSAPPVPLTRLWW